MKNRKEINKILTVSGAVLVLVISSFFLSKEEHKEAERNSSVAEEKISRKNEKQEDSTSKKLTHVPKPAIRQVARTSTPNKKIKLPNGREIPIELAGRKQQKGNQPKHFPENERVYFPDSKIALVKGLWAGGKIEGVTPVKVMNGLYFYNKAEVAGSNNVIFDSVEQRYKAWTGELVVKGRLESILEITNQYDLTILEQSEGRATLKAGEGFDNERDLSELLRVKDISIKLDLQSGRLRQM